MKTLRKEKAFTLTELIVVIAIIGILAAVLIPSLTGYISKAKKSAAEQEAAAVYQVYQSWCMGADEGSIGYGDTPVLETVQNFANYYANSIEDKNHTTDSLSVGKITFVSIETDKGGFQMKASNNYTVTIKVINSVVKYEATK